MHASPNVRVVLEVFAAIEQRDLAGFLAHVHPEFDPDAVSRFLEDAERERPRNGPAGVRPPRR